jgi:hypothetical protein
MIHKKNEIAVLCLMFLISFGCTQQAQFSIVNSILGATTTYRLSYYATNDVTSATSFTVNFNQSYLTVPDGPNNCTIKISNVTAPTPVCTCNNLVCTFKPNIQSQSSQAVEISIGSVTNPYFIYMQNVSIGIYFSPNITLNFPVVISSDSYQSMPIIVNSVSQSDYGVGSSPVTYGFNFSLSYISKNMQMIVSIPS